MSSSESTTRHLQRGLVLCALVGAALSQSVLARADSLTAIFDMPAPGAPPPGSSPWATLNLNLNDNDTISVRLNLTQGYTTSIFCFNVIGSNAGFMLSGLPPGWYGMDLGSSFGCSAVSFGSFNSFITRGDVPDRASLSFTVSRTTGFSSVYDLVELSYLGGPAVDFTTDVRSGSGFGLAGAIAETPEPVTSILLATGLFGIALWTRKTPRWSDTAG